MQCMKCGRDLQPGQVFCDECLEEMEKYPVKPGTVVLLPHYHRPYTQPKKTAKRVVPLEEQFRKVKSRNRILAWLLAGTITVAAGLGYLAAALYIEYDGKFLPGQNYSVKSTEPPSEPTEITETPN